MIYLASPYSHADPSVREIRFQITCRVTAELIRQGQPVFSPIVHSHPLTKQGLPMDWAFWESIDRELIRRFDSLLVLKLDGWEQSIGLQREIEAADSLGKPVRYHDLDARWSTWGRVAEVVRC